MAISHKNGQLQVLLDMINYQYDYELPTPLSPEYTSIVSIGKKGDYHLIKLTIEGDPSYENGTVEMSIYKYNVSTIPDQLDKLKMGIKKTTKINKALFVKFLNRRFDAIFVDTDLEEIPIKSAKELIEKGKIQLKLSESCLCYMGTLEIAIIENQ